jgi:hypothetical protein
VIGSESREGRKEGGKVAGLRAESGVESRLRWLPGLLSRGIYGIATPCGAAVSPVRRAVVRSVLVA